MDAQATYLFTYGTLMRGFDNPFAERLHNNSVFEGTGHFPGMLYLISWYPGAIFDANALSNVHGEIYRLSPQEALLMELDDYEDVFEDENSSLYLRKTVAITKENGGTVDCWVYLYNQPVSGLPLIEEGCFKRWG
ncbi:gamma-glutamylcyclotransferase family protein [Dyadobacter fanqingshengii]|uniref:Gamma-glutamylcyclotransferase n=1 Tax=Dyadobacter fanqingshengii TaxID=2906443 RepID=A0A9X1P8E7_9BACT|nr:gamma-glutamylcyclotransferase family protein [Dyadobacter fanqingshengii]MCF0038622.1 gamma-glutamylcyclotransferase [Dyadobacter fanqingshengii]USJ34545.1 gamma-glutamylcyclotransferase [Dyadobacter fanqingshengii]